MAAAKGKAKPKKKPTTKKVNESQEPREVGRPKIEIDYNLVEKLAEIQCTQMEIASVLGVSVDTLQRDEEFCGIYKKGMDIGRCSLRRLQWKRAQAGDSTMLIWLGKQYLRQRDKQDVEMSGEINNPFKGLTADELRKLANSKGR